MAPAKCVNKDRAQARDFTRTTIQERHIEYPTLQGTNAVMPNRSRKDTRESRPIKIISQKKCRLFGPGNIDNNESFPVTATRCGVGHVPTLPALPEFRRLNVKTEPNPACSAAAAAAEYTWDVSSLHMTSAEA